MSDFDFLKNVKVDPVTGDWIKGERDELPAEIKETLRALEPDGEVTRVIMDMDHAHIESPADPAYRELLRGLESPESQAANLRVVFEVPGTASNSALFTGGK